jgi:hypothetical protein
MPNICISPRRDQSSDTTALARCRLCSLGRLADVVHDDEGTAAVMWIENTAPVGAAHVCLHEHAVSFVHLSSLYIFAPACMRFAFIASHIVLPLKIETQGLVYTPDEELVPISHPNSSALSVSQL